jgi:hypothetical protein
MKVVFSGSGIVEMRGKAQGNIIQDSYGGFQLRVLKQPYRRRNANTQLIRGNFASVQSAWRSLTDTDRMTWNTNAPSGVSGFNFYSSYNNKLVNAGQAPITSFVSPAANPPIDSIVRFSGSYNTDPPSDVLDIQKESYQQLVPVSPWVPAFLWTGWVAPSQYSFPKISRIIPISAISIAPSGWDITWGTFTGFNLTPPGQYWKMKLAERYINLETGQIYTAGTYDFTADNYITPEYVYQPETSLGTGTFTSVGGNNFFTQQLLSGNSSYDFSIWKPNFFFTGWLPNSGNINIPATTAIPGTAVIFTSSGEISVQFGITTGMAAAPPDQFDIAALAIIWQNVLTGYNEGEVTYSIEADNS